MPRYSFTVHIDAPDEDAARQVYDLAKTALAVVDDGLKESAKDARIEPTLISASERDQQVRDMARRQFGRSGELEFDDGCLVSEGDDNGAYVQGWRWVDFSGTELDKDEEDL